MRPPMKENVILLNPTEDKDKYSRPVLKREESKARVQFSSKVVKGTDGKQYETSLEVDLPPEAVVRYGTEIEYENAFGIMKGQVVAVNEATNLTGDKVYFRTVYVG